MDWISGLTATAVGLGDGLVGQVPVVDKYTNVHSVYRIGTLALGAVGLAADWNPEFSDGLILASLALLASRVPAAVNGGGWQQMGMVVAAPARAASRNGAGPHIR